MKKYCDCFASQLECGQNCICENCCNRVLDKPKNQRVLKVFTQKPKNLASPVSLSSASTKCNNGVSSGISEEVSERTRQSERESKRERMRDSERERETENCADDSAPITFLQETVAGDVFMTESENELDELGGDDFELGDERLEYLIHGRL